MCDTQLQRGRLSLTAQATSFFVGCKCRFIALFCVNSQIVLLSQPNYAIIYLVEL